MAEEMKAGQRTERCLSRLQRLIPKPEARMVSRHTEKMGDEYVEVTLEFRICGAYLDPARDTMVVLATAESLESGDLELSPGFIEELISATINGELEWMSKARWRVSVDRGSLKRLMREGARREFRHGITRPISRGHVTQDEAVTVLAGILAELRPELTDALAGCGAARDGMVTIEGRGLPCPICLGHLSDDAIHSLYHRLRFLSMFDDDDEPRGK